MRPSSAPTDSSALSCFWAPLWIGCYDNAECGMRSAEWLGEVDPRGHRRVRAGTDLPLKFRIPHSALRIRRGRPARLRDRKSVVEGKSVDLGGRRIIKKKKRERGCT